MAYVQRDWGSIKVYDNRLVIFAWYDFLTGSWGVHYLFTDK